MIRVQIAPELALKMDVDVGDVDTHSRDYDVQQSKAQVYGNSRGDSVTPFLRGSV